MNPALHQLCHNPRDHHHIVAGAVELADLHPDHIGTVVAGLGQVDAAIVVDMVQKCLGCRFRFQSEGEQRPFTERKRLDALPGIIEKLEAEIGRLAWEQESRLRALVATGSPAPTYKWQRQMIGTSASSAATV